MKSLVIGLSLLAASATQAATITYSDLSNALETTEVNQKMTLGFFDASLGTLTGISLSFFGNQQTQITLGNMGSTSNAVNATAVTNLFVDTSLSSIETLFQVNRPLMSLTTPFNVTLDPMKSVVSPIYSNTKSQVWNMDVLGAFLDDFIGQQGQTFDLSCTSVSTLQIVGGGGNVLSGQSTKASCGASITYSYEGKPIPEPASLALVGAALLGAGASARRRKG